MRTVVVQNWLERDSWSGPSPDGFTVHLTEADRVAYIAWYNHKFNNKPRTPECYTKAEGEGILVEVTEALYKRIVETVAFNKRARRGAAVWAEENKWFSGRLKERDLRLVEI